MKAENLMRSDREGVPDLREADRPEAARAGRGFDAFVPLLAAFLNGFRIWTDHYANTYYTMTVGSMLESFHNFFFASLDSAGSVTVDKPPVTFWIQTASAYLFGLHGWSVILPQALAGVGSVLLLYAMVRPTFGTSAARIAALAMAATPVAAAVARTNNIDAMLVFTLLLASRLLFKGAGSGRGRTLIGAFALIGVAFNMKMLQAYMVLPAFYLFYLLAVQMPWRRKLGSLAAATAVMLVISLSWAVAVDSIPADKRPYIGSSETNSVLELAFGYNGVSRLTGDQAPGGVGGAPGGMARNDGPGGQAGGWARPDAAANGAAAGEAAGDAGAQEQNGGVARPGAMQGQPPGGIAPDGSGRQGRATGGGGAFNIGTAGPFRLFQPELSGQASWLLPFVGFALIGLFASVRRGRVTQKHKDALFWLAWLLPVMGFFSIAGFFHPYYLIMLAPPAAALTGAGWSELWRQYRSRAGRQARLFPAAVLATALFEWSILHPYDDTIGSGWSLGVAAGGILLTLLLLFAGRMTFRLSRWAAGGALLVLFAGPLYWAATPIAYGQNSMLPAAGPSGFGGGMGMGQRMAFPAGGGQAGGSGSSLNETALAYLKSHNTGEAYLFAASDYGTAAPYAIDAGEEVITLGGFSGSDPVYTVESLETLVRSGRLKYFLLSGGGMAGRGGSSEIAAWIREHGTEIPSAEWQGTRTANGSGFGRGTGGRSGGAALYEVKL